MSLSASETELQFVNWLQEHGATFPKLSVRSCAGGRGVFATGQFVKGEVAGQYPIDLILHPGVALSHPVLGPGMKLLKVELDQKLHLSDSGRYLVLLLLIWERFGSKKHKPAEGVISFLPYVNILPAPEEVQSTPFCSGEDQQLLEGTPLYSMTKQYEAWSRHIYAMLVPVIARHLGDYFIEGQTLTYHYFNWAQHCYRSRAIATPCEAEEYLGADAWTCLLPLMDSCNHSPQPQITWVYQQAADKPMIQLIVISDVIEPGEEVFINYGSKTNEQLLFAYGFILLPNPDDAITIELDRPCDTDALYDKKIAAFQRHNLSFYHEISIQEIFGKSTLNQGILHALQVLCMNNTDFEENPEGCFVEDNEALVSQGISMIRTLLMKSLQSMQQSSERTQQCEQHLNSDIVEKIQEQYGMRTSGSSWHSTLTPKENILVYRLTQKKMREALIARLGSEYPF